MKKTVLTMILSFFFMLSSNFSISSSPSTIEVNKDSVSKILVQFEDPSILIDDNRDLGSWTEQMSKRSDLDSSMLNTLKDILNSQEKRFNSSFMTDLSIKTGYSIEELNHIFKKRKKIEAIEALLLFSISLGVFFKIFTDKRTDWQRQLVKFTLLFIILLGTMWLTDCLLLRTVNSEYHQIKQLMSLTI